MRAALAAVGDPERAAGAAGVHEVGRSPTAASPRRELRALLRPLLADPALAPATRQQWDAAVRALWDAPAYREERYAALALTGHRAAREWQDPQSLSLYRHLVETGAWWDFVDPLAADRVGPILLHHRDSVTPTVRDWAVDDDLWVRRTAILAQLKHRDDTDLALLTEVLDANLEDSLHGREFFVRKAVGWALRQHARTDADWVRAYVDSRAPRLSSLSRREALKHL